MASIDDLIGSGDYLKSADIQGKEPIVTIDTVTPKEFKDNNGSSKSKLVLTFVGKQKSLVCNATNMKRIAFLHGKDYEQWPGKKITLFVDPFVEYAGQLTPAIRVKPTPNGSGAPTPAVRRPAAEFDDSVADIGDTF